MTGVFYSCSKRKQMLSAFTPGFWRFFLSFSALLLTAAALCADQQLVWRIGVDGDPLQSGYNATGEFSQENGINDPRPGRVTRLPGDPRYNATNNPTADDDFYCAGTYPIGFNGLTTNLPVPFNEPD